MSRFIIACALATLISSVALADRMPEPRPARPVPIEVDHRFAQPPPGDVAVDRAAIRASLIRARDANLAAFRAYQRAGVYPVNTYTNSMLNIWRDRDGRLCAAATIIKASGQGELVERVAKDSNFIRLADVRRGPLMDWILTSGFTQEELVAIQKPFTPAIRPTRPPVVTEVDRMRAKYLAVDQMLVANREHSLDVAVERLLER